MNLKSYALWAGAIALACVFGCMKSDSSQKEPQAKTNRGLSIDALKSGDVLVRVDSNDFTKADFLAMCALRTRIAELTNRDKLKQRSINSTAIELQTLAVYPNKVSVDSAIQSYAASNGISASKHDVAEVRQSFQRSCQKEFVPWKTFCKDFTASARKALDEEISNMALQAAIQKRYFKDNPVTVTDEETADCEKWIARYNERAAQTNAVIWANASNIWHQIVENKISFEDAANKYNQDESEPENGEWAAFTLDGFNDEPELKKRIEGMKVGEITPPIEGDNGMMILKLVEIERQDNGGEPRYVLARIFFRLPEFYETVATAELKKEMFKTKSNKQFVKFVEGLVKAANVEIVCDKKVFEEAKQALKFPTASML